MHVRCYPAITIFSFIMATLLHSPRSFGSDPPVNEAIDGIIARSSVIYSANLSYGCESAHEEDAHTDLHFAVEGDDWRLGYDAADNFRMTRGQIGFTFCHASPNEDGNLNATLSINEGLSQDELIGQNVRYIGTRLGTLPFSAQRDFIDSHREEVEQLEDHVIDGVECVCLQWRVSSKDFRHAFLELPLEIARKGKGLFRLYAAKSLNWAIPSIEYLTPDEKVVARFRATDFRKVSDEVHFPYNLDVTFHDKQGAYTSSIKVTSIDSVNEALPGRTFEMKIPQGTLVVDTRPGMAHSIFKLENQDQFRGLNAALGKGTAVLQEAGRYRLLAVNLCVGVALAVAFYWRRRTIIVAA